MFGMNKCLKENQNLETVSPLLYLDIIFLMNTAFTLGGFS